MNTLTILFLLPESRTNRNGGIPLSCRLTLNKKRQQFSTGIVVPPNWWSQEKQKIIKKNPEANELTSKINDVVRKVKSTEQQLIITGDAYDVRDIYNSMLADVRVESRTLIGVYDLKLEQMKKLLQKDYTQSTYDKFCYVKNNMVQFLKLKLKRSDIQLSKLTLQMLHQFESFLKVELGMKQVSANKVIQRLRSVVKLALDYGWITTNPFVGYKPRKVETHILYLTNDELSTLTSHEFHQPRLNLVRDIFIFSVYTGLHYHEAFSLTKENLIQEADGSIWIVYMRLKTKKWSRVPLLEQARKMLEKYNDPQNPYLLPRMENPRKLTPFYRLKLTHFRQSNVTPNRHLKLTP